MAVAMARVWNAVGVAGELVYGLYVDIARPAIKSVVCIGVWVGAEGGYRVSTLAHASAPYRSGGYFGMADVIDIMVRNIAKGIKDFIFGFAEGFGSCEGFCGSSKKW
ncbi:hypothetical protein EJ08DRAFT_665781 [Tothia fuscella]|uniref:Uncharacterized protein n=1 Tax=Tothia fuscella TaxID=1048955 RepID=A0A9P4TTK3_9PEZI|nr:hypothetical protein EJ08DRAFT_665781 [Tothia fuscella]